MVHLNLNLSTCYDLCNGIGGMMNRTSSVPKSVFSYDVDKGQYFNLKSYKKVGFERFAKQPGHLILWNRCSHSELVFETNTKFQLDSMPKCC